MYDGLLPGNSIKVVQGEREHNLLKRVYTKNGLLNSTRINENDFPLSCGKFGCRLAKRYCLDGDT